MISVDRVSSGVRHHSIATAAGLVYQPLHAVMVQATIDMPYLQLLKLCS